MLDLAGLDLPILFLGGDLALVGECVTDIPMLAGMEEPLLIWDMAIPTMAGAIFHPTDTLMHTHHAELINLKE